MKKIIQLFAILFLLSPILLDAQQYEKYDGNNEGWSINANVGPSLFYGDIKQYNIVPVSKFKNEWRASGSLILSKQLFSFLSLRAQVLAGQLAGTKRNYENNASANVYFKSNIIDYNINFKLDISEFFKPESERKFTFYTYAGIGFVDFRTKKYNLITDDLIASSGYKQDGSIKKSTTETIFPVGLGLEYKISEKVSMTFDYSRRIVNSDKLDATIGKSKHDNYDYISIGLTYHFRGPKDTDFDGVIDKMDSCKNTPLGVEVNELGCPKDKDGDGVADYLDKCPNVAGLAQFSGCPDTDGDGIQDSEDKCPSVKGLAQFFGCPDTDGDGIPDKRDRCPKIKGLAQFKGCIDTDGDGIADPDDKCPQIAGLAINLGCPAVKKEVLKVFEKALTGIQFESGKDVIKKTSNSILDEVVKAMIDNPTYNIEINGHTDNVGDAQKNLLLSQKRADAVKKYLSSKGVAAERMKSTGFGSTVPVADNTTPAGKAKNRRVEFKVVFQKIELE